MGRKFGAKWLNTETGSCGGRGGAGGLCFGTRAAMQEFDVQRRGSGGGGVVGKETKRVALHFLLFLRFDGLSVCVLSSLCFFFFLLFFGEKGGV